MEIEASRTAPIEQKRNFKFVQSRIDFWLVSTALEYHIELTTIKPGNRSDHCIISINLLLLDTHKRGKGFWKFNNNN